MAANKTQATDASVSDFIAGIENEGKRRDAEHLVRLMGEVTGKPPVMWGPSIIGFDQYHYEYESGRQGDAAAIGFSPRSSNLTVYLAGGTSRYSELLERLGPHTTGKVCLYVKRLSDVDITVLEELVRASYRYVMQNEQRTSRVD